MSRSVWALLATASRCAVCVLGPVHGGWLCRLNQAGLLQGLWRRSARATACAVCLCLMLRPTKHALVCSFLRRREAVTMLRPGGRRFIWERGLCVLRDRSDSAAGPVGAEDRR